MGTELDKLIIGNYLDKKQQDSNLNKIILKSLNLIKKKIIYFYIILILIFNF